MINYNLKEMLHLFKENDLLLKIYEFLFIFLMYYLFIFWLWSAVYYTGGPKAVSPLSQGP